MIELGKTASQGAPGQATGAKAGGVIDTSDQRFMQDVVEASTQRPVIVLLWSPIDQLSRTLAGALEKEVAVYGDAIGLARLDIDRNPMVQESLRLTEFPAAVAFHQGQGVGGFQGMPGPMQVKEFVKRIAEASGAQGGGGLAEALDAADQMLAAGAIQDAGQTYAAVMAEEPENPRAIGGLARALLALDQPDQAREALSRAPDALADDPAIAAARAAIELAEQAAGAGEAGELRARLAADPADLQARFDLAVVLSAQNDADGAIDELLELFRRDREWNDGAAKTQLFKLFDSLGAADPRVHRARRRLSSMIFS